MIEEIDPLIESTGYDFFADVMSSADIRAHPSAMLDIRSPVCESILYSIVTLLCCRICLSGPVKYNSEIFLFVSPDIIVDFAAVPGPHGVSEKRLVDEPAVCHIVDDDLCVAYDRVLDKRIGFIGIFPLMRSFKAQIVI